MHRSTAGFVVALALAWAGCAETTRVRVPAALVLESGDGQSGAVGRRISDPLVVKVTDAGGSGIPGVAVEWTITWGGGGVGADTMSASVTRTDQAGRTSATWTLGTTSGPNTLIAFVSGADDIAPVSFVATGLPGPPARLAFAAQPGDVTAELIIAPPLAVAVQDAFGNTVSDATTPIALAIMAGTGTAGAKLSGTSSQAAAAGVATFADLSVSAPGTGYQLTATATASGLASAVSAPFAVRANPAMWLAGAWELADTVDADYGYYVSPSGPGPLLYQTRATRTLTLAAVRLGADSLVVTGTVSTLTLVDCSEPQCHYVTQTGPSPYADTLVVTGDALYGLLPDPTYALPLPATQADTLAWNADAGPVCAAKRAATAFPDRMFFDCTHRIHMRKPGGQ